MKSTLWTKSNAPTGGRFYSQWDLAQRAFVGRSGLQFDKEIHARIEQETGFSRANCNA